MLTYHVNLPIICALDNIWKIYTEDGFNENFNLVSDSATS